MINTVLYARSTANQLEFQNQIKSLTEFASEKKLNIKGFFSDTDKENKGLKSAFQLLDTLEDVQLLVISPDRITEDMFEMYEILNKYHVITPNLTYEQLVNYNNSLQDTPMIQGNQQ